MCKCIYAASVRIFTPITCHLLARNAYSRPSWLKPNIAVTRGNLSPGDAAYSNSNCRVAGCTSSRLSDRNPNPPVRS